MDITNALLTGMTRYGTFRVEDGKIRHGIKSLGFTGSMLMGKFKFPGKAEF